MPAEIYLHEYDTSVLVHNSSSEHRKYTGNKLNISYPQSISCPWDGHPQPNAGLCRLKWIDFDGTMELEHSGHFLMLPGQSIFSTSGIILQCTVWSLPFQHTDSPIIYRVQKWKYFVFYFNRSRNHITKANAYHMATQVLSITWLNQRDRETINSEPDVKRPHACLPKMSVLGPKHSRDIHGQYPFPVWKEILSRLWLCKAAM